MMVNSDCTLYRYNSSTGGYDRFYIDKVYWQQDKAGKALKSGLENVDSTTVYLYSDAYLPLTPAKDMLVKGQCPYAFTGTTEQDISAQVKAFRKNYDFVVVKSFADYMFGSLPHVEISAD